ncbi:hypothetical protein F4Y93_11570 [Candidatus Poribacteria bacterium]|nr:hypothetical protein [Candidatus Poribacteria bacterium]
MKYIHKCALTVLFYLLVYFIIFSSNVSAENTVAAADGFLKQLLGAEHYGMGGSFVSTTRGASAISSNPAGIATAEVNQFAIHTTRFPRTVTRLSKSNHNANYEEYSQYEQRASGIQTLNCAFPIGRFGTFAAAFSVLQEGRFRRVNHLGKAINSFPENNIALGLSYGLHILENTLIGIDTKWLRSKVTDTDGVEHLGHGYAYNIGVIQQVSDAIHVGVVARNLSNGLSFSDVSIPDMITRTIAVGVAYRREISDVTLRFGFDVHPPFQDGIRTNVGTEVWYRHRIGARIGYLRDTETRYASVLLLEDAAFETEERLWKTEGFSFGLGFRFANITFDAAYTPQFIPTTTTEERINTVQGENIYTFSIGQTF